MARTAIPSNLKGIQLKKQVYTLNLALLFHGDSKFLACLGNKVATCKGTALGANAI